MRWSRWSRVLLCLALGWTSPGVCILAADDEPPAQERSLADEINPLRSAAANPPKGSGRWVEWRSGAKWEGEYQDNRRHGIWEGTIAELDGTFLEDSQYAGFELPVVITVELDRNVLQGEVSAIDAKGRSLFSWHFDQGVLEGRAVWWHPNGQVRRQTTYRAGLLDGPVTEWGEDGDVIEQETYREGRASESHVAWYEPGCKRYEGYSQRAGEVMRHQFDWLTLQWTQTVVDEHPQEQRCGRWTAWYENGQKKVQGSYEEGEPEGRFTWWHANGLKMAEGEYIAGKRHGLWRWWHSNGHKQIEGEYEYGEPLGGWVAWTADGKTAAVDRTKTILLMDWDVSPATTATAASTKSTLPDRPIRATTPKPAVTGLTSKAPTSKPAPTVSPRTTTTSPKTTTASPWPAEWWAAPVSPYRSEPTTTLAPKVSPPAARPAPATSEENFSLFGLITGQPKSQATPSSPRSGSSSGSSSTARVSKPFAAPPLRTPESREARREGPPTLSRWLDLD